MHNDIEIIENKDYCLIYNKPILSKGLSWQDLISWWEESHKQAKKDLYNRLELSMEKSSIAEKYVFKTYYQLFEEELGEKLPALIPQVYFCYDPITHNEIKRLRMFNGQVRPSLPVQRMDFLILFSDKDRVIIEIDGKHHYSNEEEVMVRQTNGNYYKTKRAIANPQNYAIMVSEDRKLRLRGYEIYRFGGYEICRPNEKGLLSVVDTAEKILKDFFLSLFEKFGIVLKK